MPNNSDRLGRVFKSLSHPVRRSTLAQLSRGPASLSELARAVDMALPSFMEHMDMLSDAGMVRSRRDGRSRIYQLVPAALKSAEQWIVAERAAWDKRLTQAAGKASARKTTRR